jgi:hypothetical protein
MYFPFNSVSSSLSAMSIRTRRELGEPVECLDATRSQAGLS